MYYPGLEGKNALLVGGHSNLGQHVTKLFAASGANVVIAARDTQRAHEVAAEARKLGKGKVIVVEVDVTDRRSLENAVLKTQELGAIDVFYQGTGWSVIGSFLDSDPELWDELYVRNLRSAMMAYKIVLPIMIDQRNGCVITLSSVMGRRLAPFEPVYGAMKCALIYLAQSLALDVARHGVRINVVAPGPSPPRDLSEVSANSNFHSFMKDKNQFNAIAASFAADIPMRRLGEPENVAHAVLYLASPVTGGFQTGQVIGVDGGWWMPK